MYLRNPPKACDSSATLPSTYAVSLAVSLFDRNPRTLVLFAWHDMYTRRHRIEWHSWCTVRPRVECACVASSLQLKCGRRRRGRESGWLNDISFSRFSKVDCANARYVYALLTVYIFAVVHPRDFRNRFARHNAFDRCVQSFAYRLHLLRFVKWNFLCLPNRMKWNLFKTVILEMCYVNIWLCSVTNQMNWV